VCKAENVYKSEVQSSTGVKIFKRAATARRNLGPALYFLQDTVKPLSSCAGRIADAAFSKSAAQSSNSWSLASTCNVYPWADAKLSRGTIFPLNFNNFMPINRLSAHRVYTKIEFAFSSLTDYLQLLLFISFLVFANLL
jgi:hypothetical protein